MIWRLLPAMAVLFWAVMTVLLVRTVYFPGESSLAEVPPRFVFDLFLKQASRQTNTLHLQHRGEKSATPRSSFSTATNRKRTPPTASWRAGSSNARSRPV